MLSKKHSNPFYWKDKLESLDILPGDAATAKDAMWDKLYGRLQEKPTTDRTGWYWIAAGLLPLIFIALTMVNSTENILVREVMQKEKGTNTIPAFLQPVSKEAVAFSVSATVEKKQPMEGIKVNAKNKIVTDTVKASETVVTALPENPETAITTNSLPPADTTVSITITALTKKKLPVVHINELETFPAQFTAPANYAQNLSEIKSKKNKTNNISIATQQNSIGFKIKLSSKN